MAYTQLKRKSWFCKLIMTYMKHLTLNARFTLDEKHHGAPGSVACFLKLLNQQFTLCRRLSLTPDLVRVWHFNKLILLCSHIPQRCFSHQLFISTIYLLNIVDGNAHKLAFSFFEFLKFDKHFCLILLSLPSQSQFFCRTHIYYDNDAISTCTDHIILHKIYIFSSEGNQINKITSW